MDYFDILINIVIILLIAELLNKTKLFKKFNSRVSKTRDSINKHNKEMYPDLPYEPPVSFYDDEE